MVTLQVLPGPTPYYVSVSPQITLEDIDGVDNNLIEPICDKLIIAPGNIEEVRFVGSWSRIKLIQNLQSIIYLFTSVFL